MAKNLMAQEATEHLAMMLPPIDAIKAANRRQPIMVDALNVDGTVAPDTLVRIGGGDTDTLMQVAGVFVKGANARVDLIGRGSRLVAELAGDTVTLATMFEDIARKLRGEQ
jgi:hypothetical protein